MICLTLDGKTMADNLRLLKRNRKYAGILELRADMLDLFDESERQKVIDFPSEAGLPVILTIRRDKDHGGFNKSEEERKELLKQLSQGNFSFVDMEIDLNYPSLEYQLISQGKRIIRSLHDFDGGLPDILPELARAISSSGEIPKFAVMLRGLEDALELFRLGKLLSNIPQKILIGMGPYGLPTRILYRRLGGMLTFASDKDPNKIGLPSPEILSCRYLSDKIGPDTKFHATTEENEGCFKSTIQDVYVPFRIDDINVFKELCHLLSIDTLETMQENQHNCP